jgi:hypothetical protein
VVDTDDPKLSRGERFSALRDAALFGLGAAGFIHELFSGAPTERPFLLGLCGVMMGLGKALEVLGSWFGGGGHDRSP